MEEIAVVEPAPAVETEVFLGLSREHAANVPPRAVVRFVKDEVMPTFPGATVVRAQGWWEGSTEPARVIVLVHAPDQTDAVYQIARRWTVLWQQSAVLVVSKPVTSALVTP